MFIVHGCGTISVRICISNILTFNSPFHVKQWNVVAVIIKRDVTAGVHSSAILGVLCMVTIKKVTQL